MLEETCGLLLNGLFQVFFLFAFAILIYFAYSMEWLKTEFDKLNKGTTKMRIHHDGVTIKSEKSTKSIDRSLRSTSRPKTQFDIQKLDVNIPEADIILSGNENYLTINQNQFDFDKFKSEIFDKIESGNNIMIKILNEFKQQLIKSVIHQDKSNHLFYSEVANALDIIIGKATDIKRFQDRVIERGVRNHEVLKLYHDVQFLLEEEAGVPGENENAQIKDLSDHKESAEDKIEQLQSEIKSLGLTTIMRYDPSTVNENIYISKDNKAITNKKTALTFAGKSSANQLKRYAGVLGTITIGSSDEISFVVEVQMNLTESITDESVIFEIAFNVRSDIDRDIFDISGWSFGAKYCEVCRKMCIMAWRKVTTIYHKSICSTQKGDSFSGKFRFSVERLQRRIAVIEENNFDISYTFTDVETYGDICIAFAVLQPNCTETILRLQ